MLNVGFGKRHENKYCSPSYGSYTNLYDADAACLLDPDCGYLFDENCDGTGIELCKTTASTATSCETCIRPSCIYERGSPKLKKDSL